MDYGTNKFWLRFYEWGASDRELSREFGGRPTPFLGFGFLVVWPVWAEITFLLLDVG